MLTLDTMGQYAQSVWSEIVAEFWKVMVGVEDFGRFTCSTRRNRPFCQESHRQVPTMSAFVVTQIFFKKNEEGWWPYLIVQKEDA